MEKKAVKNNRKERERESVCVCVRERERERRVGAAVWLSVSRSRCVGVKG